MFLQHGNMAVWLHPSSSAVSLLLRLLPLLLLLLLCRCQPLRCLIQLCMKDGLHVTDVFLQLLDMQTALPYDLYRNIQLQQADIKVW
jgi:hypothetical protein